MEVVDNGMNKRIAKKILKKKDELRYTADQVRRAARKWGDRQEKGVPLVIHAR